MEGWCIVGSIASYSNNLAKLDQTVDQHKFIIWLGPRQNLELAFNGSEIPHVSNSAYNSDLVFISPCLLLNGSVDSVSEAFTCHAYILFLVISEVCVSENIGFFRNSCGCFNIIASHHPNVYTRKVAARDSFCDSRSERILQAHYSNKNKALLGSFFVLN